MKTFLLQIQTKDFGLQLRTEVTAVSLGQLKLLAAKMVKENPAVKGMVYRIFTVTKSVTGRFDSVFVKQAVISN